MKTINLIGAIINVWYCIFVPVLLKAQFNYDHVYDFPIKNINKIVLSGGVGEIRANHFHAGLDIPANVGTPIYATADGYVYMLRPSTYGYGNFVFLAHPDYNQRTLYAHLDAFAPDLADYVRAKQYETEKFENEIFPPKEMFPIKKGDLIGYMGNTGASAGSHLHYEIRTLDDIALNPLLFAGSTNIQDNVPPIFVKLALQPLDLSSSINQTSEKTVLTLQKVAAGRYESKVIPKVRGAIGVETITYDLIDYSGFTCGTTKLKLLLDGKEIFAHNLNQIEHLYNRCMNVHIDYATYRKTYQAFQRCYVKDGNKLNNYRTNNSKGVILIDDEQIHTIQLVGEDNAGNQSTVTCKVQGYKPLPNAFQLAYSPYNTYLSHEINENFLHIYQHFPKQKSDTALVYFGTITQKLPFSYVKDNKAVYSWDLRKGLPDFVEINAMRHAFYFTWLIPPQKDFIYQEENLAIKFEKGALFDTLYLKLKTTDNALAIGDTQEPVFDYYEVAWQRKPPSLPAKQWGMYLQDGANSLYQATQWQAGDSSLTFKARSFGNFALLKDNTPPVLRLASKSEKQIAFFISDNLSGIESFRATLNDEFLLMKYESKNAYIWSETKDKMQKLKGNFVLIVTDKAGNSTKFSTILP